MEFTSYASGSRGNSYTVFDGETPLMLEAGLPIKELRKRAGFSLSSMEACLISHEHQDHSRSVRDVMAAGVDVFTSQGTAAFMDCTGHRMQPFRTGEVFSVGSWEILPFAAVHDAVDPVSFLLYSRYSGEKVLFATDTGFIRYKFKGLTHIIIEANYCDSLIDNGDLDILGKKRLVQTHMSFQRLKRMLRANNLSKLQSVFLIHLSSRRSDPDRFREEIQELTGKPTYCCEQNQILHSGFVA